MLKPVILLFILLLLGNAVMAQRIKSGTYRAMLSTMLSHKVPEVSVVEASKNSSVVTFLDSREKEERAVSYIPNSKWIGYKNFEISSLAAMDKGKPIVVYCSVGYRSEKICEQLIKAGFTKVYNLYGGIFEWKNQGHEVVNDKGPTEKVHAFSNFWGTWLDKGEKVFK